MFVDEVKKVSFKAGDGGDGCVSFRREKYEPKGGPDGGNGGKGGDLILMCDENVGDLTQFRFVPHATAKNGSPGMGRNKQGASGSDKILKLPPGTAVLDIDSGALVVELLEHGQQVILLHGGKGGLGNTVFKSSVNQAPRKNTPGEPGEAGDYRLVLKTIADAGLVGLPNAGKSSFLRTVTHAQPKIGAYPFTTLHPTVGVMQHTDESRRLFIADIPGLIDGASCNKGLGHQFLRHIERCKILLVMLDMAGVDERDPLQDYDLLLTELKFYDPNLLDRPRFVVANKMDLPSAAANLKRFAQKYSERIFPISCQNRIGLSELKKNLFAIFEI